MLTVFVVSSFGPTGLGDLTDVRGNVQESDLFVSFVKLFPSEINGTTDPKELDGV